MKKIICVLIAVSMLLCGLALAEGKTIRPMPASIDLAAPADGTYGVFFQPADLTDGALKFTVYTEDCYDIADISAMAPGDTIWFGGMDFEVYSVEQGDDLLVNGGMDEGGFNMRAFEEDNCWKVVMEDDYTTWSDSGETTLPLSEDVTFTDGWDIEKAPVTVSGAEAVAEAITGTDMDYFAYFNTTLRVEGGEIVEITRSFMP